jgi:hypothetical protein
MEIAFWANLKISFPFCLVNVGRAGGTDQPEVLLVVLSRIFFARFPEPTHNFTCSI